MPPPSQDFVTAAELSEADWPSRVVALTRFPAGPIPAEFHPAVVGLLAAPEAHQRAAAVAAVSRIGGPAVPLLLAALGDGAVEDADHRRAVVVALGTLGPSARPATARLGELLDDPWLGGCARQALASIEPRPGMGWPWLVIPAVLLTAAVLAGPNAVVPAVVALAVVGLCVAVGVWWVKPGAAVLVLGLLVVAAAVLAVGVTGSLADVFGVVSRALERR